MQMVSLTMDNISKFINISEAASSYSIRVIPVLLIRSED